MLKINLWIRAAKFVSCILSAFIGATLIEYYNASKLLYIYVLFLILLKNPPKPLSSLPITRIHLKVTHVGFPFWRFVGGRAAYST